MEVPKCSSIVACLILELLLSTFYNSVKSSRLDFFLKEQKMELSIFPPSPFSSIDRHISHLVFSYIYH